MKIYSQKDRESSKVVIYVDGRRRSFGFAAEVLQDRKFRRELEDCFEDIELSNKTGSHLEAKSWETLRHLERTHPRIYSNLLKCGAFDPKQQANAVSPTISEAFDEYIKRTYTSPRTIDNWTQTKRRLISHFGEGKRVRDITLLEMKKCFAELVKKYSKATLHKDHKNVKQLWRECSDNGLIESNPLTKFQFKAAPAELVAAKQYVAPEWFAAALECIPGKQQRALFSYYRWLGARQNDPRGDEWQHLDLDGPRPKVFRSDCKKKRKLGWCPVPPQLVLLLRAWKEEVVLTKGVATGPIFPWLFGRSNSRHHQYFVKRLERNGVPVWDNFFNALRASRSREIRAMRNGRKLEQLWIGHSEAVADLHYDVGNRTEDEQFIEDTYFGFVCDGSSSAATPTLEEQPQAEVA